MTPIGQLANRALALDWNAARALCLAEAQRILGRSAASEDAAQEAVIRAWRRRATCRTPERPAPWLAAIARREAWRLAERAPREEALPTSANAPTDAVAGGGGAGPVERLPDALAGLAPADRDLLVGRYWLDLPDPVLARRFGIAESTVRVRLHRARARLRHTLLET